MVWAIIDRFGRHGITATGRSARKLSACAIVAIALRQEAKLNIELDEVKKIWKRYGRFFMPDGPVGLQNGHSKRVELLWLTGGKDRQAN